MSALVETSMGLQVRAGSALERAERELAEPAGQIEIVCAWCPDAAIRERSARAGGRVVSHGICREHRAAIEGEVFGDE